MKNIGMLLALFFLNLLVLNQVFSTENNEMGKDQLTSNGGVFTITLKEMSAIVEAPKKASIDKTLIIKNESFSDIYAKIIDEKGYVFDHLTIVSKGKVVKTFSAKNDEDEIFLIILSPSLHELQLKEGNSYEIPPAR